MIKLRISSLKLKFSFTLFKKFKFLTFSPKFVSQLKKLIRRKNTSFFNCRGLSVKLYYIQKTIWSLSLKNRRNQKCVLFFFFTILFCFHVLAVHTCSNCYSVRKLVDSTSSGTPWEFKFTRICATLCKWTTLVLTLIFINFCLNSFNDCNLTTVISCKN